jgi:hypothetical protein
MWRRLGTVVGGTLLFALAFAAGSVVLFAGSTSIIYGMGFGAVTLVALGALAGGAILGAAVLTVRTGLIRKRRA